jgi:hypothetical protein
VAQRHRSAIPLPEAKDLASTDRNMIDRLQRRSASLVDTLSRRPALCVLTIGLVGMLGSAVVAYLAGVPVPIIHDEFAYLLAGDTFASGRVANPTHPLWHHFETFHVIFEPTYAAKYPPGQGIFLALGQILGGHPVVGVWLSVGLMSAAITWMLFGWVPARWAILGGFLSVLQLGLVSYWAQSYWGGAVAAAGGALLFGSVRRIVVRPRVLYGVTCGFGVVILAATRPMEGLLATVPTAVVLVYFLMFRAIDRSAMLAALVPCLVVVAAGLAGLGYVNWRTTGYVARMPYQVYEDAYASAPSFLWERPSPHAVHYRHVEIQRYWMEWGAQRHMALQQPRIFALASLEKVAILLRFFFGAAALALPLLIRALRDRWMVFAVAVSAVVVSASLFTKGTYPHYVAPVAGLLMLIMTQVLRKLWVVPRVWRYPGKHLVVVIIAATAVATGMIVGGVGSALSPTRFGEERMRLSARLEASGGNHLVIVRYAQDHNVHEEWVYNRADIDASPVVWARDMGEERNARLLDYFHDRRVWLLEVGSDRVLREYAQSNSVKTEKAPAGGGQ